MNADAFILRLQDLAIAMRKYIPETEDPTLEDISLERAAQDLDSAIEQLKAYKIYGRKGNPH